MAIRSKYTDRRPTHHFTLSDGTTEIGFLLCDGRGNVSNLPMQENGIPRTAMQTRSGDPEYSDFELPYTPITQKDWSGGRGLADFEKDKARYYTAHRIDSTGEGLILGPKEIITTGYKTTLTPFTGSEAYNSTQLNYYASAYTPSATFSLRMLGLSIRPSTDAGTSAPTMIGVGFEIRPDDSNKPHATTVLASTWGKFSATLDVWETRWLPISCTLNAATKYWLVVYHEDSLEISIDGSETSNRFMRDVLMAGSWSEIAANKAIAWQLSNYADSKSILFEYKSRVYALVNPDNQTAARLLGNGLAGNALASGGQLWKLKTSLNLSGQNLAGKIVQLAGGPGYDEPVNWRVIVSNTTTGTNDEIIVTPPWNVEHTTSTNYAILGMDTWEEITGHGLTKPVTSVLVYDETIYMAQGSGTNIRRGRFASGSWSWADDGTNKADLLALIPDSTGVFKIWKSINYGAAIASASVQTWGTDLTFGTNIVCGNPRTKITGLAVYGNPLLPWALKEDSIGSVNNGVYAEVPVNEMRAVRSEKNGAAWMQFGVYLYFTMLDGLERYYDNRMDDIGPNRDEGLGFDRQGPITALVSFPGRFYAAVDAGANNKSSILCHNGTGWHDIYTTESNVRLRSMFIQVIPGQQYARLWFSTSSDIYWLPVAINPRKASGYQYTSQGYLISGWFSGSFNEVNKFWKSVAVFSENLSANVNVKVYYQTDSDTDTDTWNALPTTFTTSPMQEVDISALDNVTGKRWRYKIELNTNNAGHTPRVKALTVDAVTRVKPKKSWSVTVLADDTQTMDLNGGRYEWTVDELMTQLTKWADSDEQAAPLLMRNLHKSRDNKLVFIDLPRVTPIQASNAELPHTMRAILSMTMTEA